MRIAWMMIVPLAVILVVLVLMDIHDTKKRYREDIAKRDRIIAEQQKKEMERMQRQVRKEMADDGYFIVKEVEHD